MGWQPGAIDPAVQSTVLLLGRSQRSDCGSASLRQHWQQRQQRLRWAHRQILAGGAGGCCARVDDASTSTGSHSRSRPFSHARLLHILAYYSRFAHTRGWSRTWSLATSWRKMNNYHYYHDMKHIAAVRPFGASWKFLKMTAHPTVF